VTSSLKPTCRPKDGMRCGRPFLIGYATPISSFTSSEASGSYLQKVGGNMQHTLMSDL
jgi:hypothetical protein